MAAGDVAVSQTKANGFTCNLFDGVDDYVEIPHSPKQLGANLSNGFTISAWINPRGLGEAGSGGNGRILDKTTGTTAGAGFGYYISSTQKIEFRLNAGTGRASTDNIPFGTWTHVLVTVDNAQIATHYFNGASQGGGDLVQTISTITTTNAPRIGTRSTATDKAFDGSIRSVKMWNKVLSSTEIAQDYAGQATATSNMIHNFRLGGDYTDYGTVGTAATNSGSVVATISGDVATAVKTQRTTTGATGKFYISRGQEGQVITVAIDE